MAQAYPWQARDYRTKGAGMAAFPPGKAPGIESFREDTGIPGTISPRAEERLPVRIPTQYRPPGIPASALGDVFQGGEWLLQSVLDSTDPSATISTDAVEAAVEFAFPEAPPWVAQAVSTVAHAEAPEFIGVLDILWMAEQLSQSHLGNVGNSPNTVPSRFVSVALCPAGPIHGGDTGHLYVQNNVLSAQLISEVNSCLDNQGADSTPQPGGVITNNTMGIIREEYWYDGHFYRARSLEGYNGMSLGPPNHLPGQSVAGFYQVDPEVWPRNALTVGQMVSLMPWIAPYVSVQPQPLPWKLVSRETTPFHQLGPDARWRPDPLIVEKALQSSMLTLDSPWGRNVPQPWLPPQADIVVEPELFQQTLRRLQDEQKIKVQRPRRKVFRPKDYQYPWDKPKTLAKRGPPKFGPPKSGIQCEKKVRVPKALIHGLAASTYAGGTIRNLFKSIPPSCRSRIRYGKKRRYDSMLRDVMKCWKQVDWRKFTKLETEMLIKYWLEGYALSQMNAVSSYVWQGANCAPVISRTGGFGLGTAVLHAAPPSSAGPSSHGGPWSGRISPFELMNWLGSYWEG